MFSDGSNDARTYKTNEADGDHKNFEQQHTIAPMVPIEMKVTLALCRLKESMPRSKLVILRKPERIYVKLGKFNFVEFNFNVFFCCISYIIY